MRKQLFSFSTAGRICQDGYKTAATDQCCSAARSIHFCLSGILLQLLVSKDPNTSEMFAQHVAGSFFNIWGNVHESLCGDKRIMRQLHCTNEWLSDVGRPAWMLTGNRIQSNWKNTMKIWHSSIRVIITSLLRTDFVVWIWILPIANPQVWDVLVSWKFSSFLKKSVSSYRSLNFIKRVKPIDF